MNEELLKQFPVYIDYLEFKDQTGIDLAEEGVLYNKEIAHINRFLYDVHTDIYYYLLYANIKKSVKDRIIQRNIQALEEPIKLALIYQAEYLISLGGKSVGVEDLSNIKSDGSIEILDGVKIKDKMICLKSFYILQNTSPQLLYGIKDPYSINNPQGAT